MQDFVEIGQIDGRWFCPKLTASENSNNNNDDDSNNKIDKDLSQQWPMHRLTHNLVPRAFWAFNHIGTEKAQGTRLARLKVAKLPIALSSNLSDPPKKIRIN